MRLRTFIATYLLILAVLFSSISIVSFYLNNSQINMLKAKSTGQFQTIVSSLDRDIAVLWGRENAGGGFYDEVETLVRGYARYYSRHNIDIALTQSGDESQSELTFAAEDGYFINITGQLSAPFQHFRLEYTLDISENIADMRSIQNTLLLSTGAFSVIAAVALYILLSVVFRPLAVVADASRKIASGQFGERIHVNAKNELAQVAVDFNKMAERIEQQIIILEEEAENKQQFVDNFAHEMRTPLTSIYGYAEYMNKALLDEGEVIELSERIMGKASYLEEIANSLLQLAMLRDYVPERREVPLQDLFEDIAQTIEGIEYESDVDTIAWQEDLLKSLLLNLCFNAAKAGATTIRMAVNGGTLSVTDNGCGIPKDALAKVTEPFYRVDAARNRKHGGAGLGLSLCKRIAEAHNAEMSIKSKVGEGTSVHITFTTP